MAAGRSHLVERPTLWARVWRGAVELSPLEKELVHRFVAEVPPELRLPLEAQIRAANLIQRDPGWTELRFYTLVGGRVDRSGLPVLPVRPGEVRILSLTFAPMADEPRHAAFWAVDR